MVQSEEEIEEVHRIGEYNEGDQKPLKVRIRSQTAVENILAKSEKLARVREYKDV